MKIQFVGAAGRVTGSCSYLQYPRTGLEFLVDCGLVQGEPNERALNSRPWPFNPERLSYVFLTHAHLDHCGLIPRLYKDGFTGKVVCTRFTAELATLNLKDAVKHDNYLYSPDNVDRIRFEHIDDRKDFGFSTRLPIADDLFVSFLRSAHIGGSCGISISWKDQADKWSEINFSGDVGNNTEANCYQSLLSHRQVPFGFPRHMVLESTYGDRNRSVEYSSYDGRIEKLASVIRSALVVRSGPLVIPCFSIHRTQEIIVDLHVVLDKLLASESRDVDGGIPLLRTPEIIDNVIKNGLSVRHIEGRKSLIGQWPTEQQDEWLGWFTREETIVNGKSTLVLMPRDQSEATLAVVREKLCMLRKTNKRRVTVEIDSPLALKMCGVYSNELNRRKKWKTTEAMYRNRGLAGRLGLESEREVDDLLQQLLPDQDKRKAAFANYDLVVAASGGRQGQGIGSIDTIFVTGGGMCEGGPVIQHLKSSLTNENATILLTGYAPPQSIAGKLRAFTSMDDELRHTESLNIFGTKISYADIKADIADIGPFYSGHADQSSLVDFLFTVRAKSDDEPQPTRVFLNHGDDRKRKPLAEAIRARAARADTESQRLISGIEMPSDDQRWFDLEADAWIEAPGDGIVALLAFFLQELLGEQRKTNELLSQLIQTTRQ